MKEKKAFSQLSKKKKKRVKNHVRKRIKNKKPKISRKKCQIETNSKKELCYYKSDRDEQDAFLDLDENQNFNNDHFIIVK